MPIGRPNQVCQEARNCQLRLRRSPRRARGGGRRDLIATVVHASGGVSPHDVSLQLIVGVEKPSPDDEATVIRQVETLEHCAISAVAVRPLPLQVTS